MKHPPHLTNYTALLSFCSCLLILSTVDGMKCNMSTPFRKYIHTAYDDDMELFQRDLEEFINDEMDEDEEQLFKSTFYNTITDDLKTNDLVIRAHLDIMGAQPDACQIYSMSLTESITSDAVSEAAVKKNLALRASTYRSTYDPALNWTIELDTPEAIKINQQTISPEGVSSIKKLGKQWLQSSTEESIESFLKNRSLISEEDELILKSQTTINEMKSLTKMMDVGDAGILDYQKAQIVTSKGKTYDISGHAVCVYKIDEDNLVILDLQADTQHIQPFHSDALDQNLGEGVKNTFMKYKDSMHDLYNQYSSGDVDKFFSFLTQRDRCSHFLNVYPLEGTQPFLAEDEIISSILFHNLKITTRTI